MKTLILMTALALSALGCSANGTLNTNGKSAANVSAEQQARQQRINQQAEQNRTDLAAPITSTPASAPVAPATPATSVMATPQPTPAKPVAVAQAPQAERQPPVVAAILPGPKDVAGLLIIGFRDLDPCTDNAYERAIAMPFGNPLQMQRLMLPRKLNGRCAAVKQSRYFIHIAVDGVEMVARYDSGLPVSYCTVKDGATRLLPLTPAGEITRWLMPSGAHTISYDLYEPAPAGDCYQFVKTVKRSFTFPNQHDWGWTQKEPEAYLH